MFAVVEIPFASNISGTSVPNGPAAGTEGGERFSKLHCKPGVAELDTTTFVEEHMPKVEVAMDGIWIMDITRG